MKNLQKGFIVPLLLIVALVLMGGGIYIYKNKNIEVSTPVNIGEHKSNEPQQQTNTQDFSGLKIYENAKYKFSIQYPQTKYIDDNKARENGIYLHPPTQTPHFYPDNVTLIFSANDVECSRFAGYKKPDGQTLTVGGIMFEHVSEVVRTSQNKLIDNYEVFDKYFYTKGNTCYSATLHTSTSLSKLDKSDMSGNKLLSETEIQKQWMEIDNEINTYKSDFKKIITSFKLL